MSLPILSNSFFEQHRPQLAVFQKWERIAQWSPRFMPIYEWDDVLFVGCSESPEQQIKADCKVVYVFCEAEVLNHLWEEYQSPTVLMNQQSPLEPADRTVVFAKKEEDAPVGLSEDNTVSAAPQSASFDDLGISADESPSLEMSLESGELATPEEEGLQGLEGLALGAPVVETADSEVLPPPPPVLEKTAVFAKEEELSDPAAEIPEPPEQEHTNTKTITLFTSITSATATPEQVIKGVFKEMGNIYQKSMLLLKKGDQVVPWKWDDKFEKSNPQHKKTAIPLNVPSPFRVVFKTQKSYHGYIVPNDQNDKFFAEWNEAQNPDHLTLSPIIIDDVVIGMVLGIGDKSADSKTTLLQTEHLADAVAKKLKSSPAILTAA